MGNKKGSTDDIRWNPKKQLFVACEQHLAGGSTYNQFAC